MKFMVNWNIHEDKRHEVLELFAQMSLDDYKSQQGPSVKVIGRWHDLVRTCGVVIFETDDPEALNLWLLNWSDFCDFDIAPVLDDDEAHAAAKKYVAGK
jgi:hypothetical protein